MRTYAQNSPEAATRLVVLAMLADGHLSRSEIEALDRFDGYQQLGLDRHQVHELLSDFCEDLMATSPATWTDACRIDAHTLGQLLAEIDDPQTQRKVLRLCVSVVEADAHLADAESKVLAGVARYWGLQREMLAAEEQRPDRVAADPSLN